MPYDDKRAVIAALRVRPGDPGVIVPGAGVRDDAVTHVCPECAGPLAGAELPIELCWACRGAGTMTNHELTVYEARLQLRAQDEERRNGTR